MHRGNEGAIHSFSRLMGNNWERTRVKRAERPVLRSVSDLLSFGFFFFKHSYKFLPGRLKKNLQHFQVSVHVKINTGLSVNLNVEGLQVFISAISTDTRLHWHHNLSLSILELQNLTNA